MTWTDEYVCTQVQGLVQGAWDTVLLRVQVVHVIPVRVYTQVLCTFWVRVTVQDGLQYSTEYS